MKKFNELTKYIPKFEGDNFGQWVIDEVNDGSPEHPIQMPYTLLDDVADDFMDSLIKFCREHPEYEDKGYHDTLKERCCRCRIRIKTRSTTGCKIYQCYLARSRLSGECGNCRLWN